MSAVKSKRPTAAEVHRWMRLLSTTHSDDGKAYTDIPRFEKYRRELLATCAKHEAFAVALRDPFAPGAAAVIKDAGDWAWSDEGDAINWGSYVEIMGEALDWGLRGADMDELRRRRDENLAKWARIMAERRVECEGLVSSDVRNMRAISITDSWLKTIIELLPDLKPDERTATLERLRAAVMSEFIDAADIGLYDAYGDMQRLKTLIAGASEILTGAGDVMPDEQTIRTADDILGIAFQTAGTACDKHFAAQLAWAVRGGKEVPRGRTMSPPDPDDAGRPQEGSPTTTECLAFEADTKSVPLQDGPTAGERLRELHKELEGYRQRLLDEPQPLRLAKLRADEVERKLREFSVALVWIITRVDDAAGGGR